MKEWVCCLQNAITAAHNSDQAPEVRGFGSIKERNEPLFAQHGSPNLNGNTDEDKQLLLQVRKIPGNEVCADCKSLSRSYQKSFWRKGTDFGHQDCPVS